MRIELVGGQDDGAILTVQFLNDAVNYFGYTYQRRDRAYDSAAPMPYNADGDRLYDYVKPDQKG